MRGRPLSAPGNNATIHVGAAVPGTAARGLSWLPVGVKERGRCCEGVKLPVVKADYETEAVRVRQYDSMRREPLLEFLRVLHRTCLSAASSLRPDGGCVWDDASVRCLLCIRVGILGANQCQM